MIAKLYSHYDLPLNHEQCHLLEHLINRQFLRNLEDNGYSRPFFGWVNAQTIDSSIFFDVEVYNEHILSIFKDTINSFSGITCASHIDLCIAHIEAETSSLITIGNKDMLCEQLTLAIDDSPNRAEKETLESKEYPHLFREIIVEISLHQVSSDIQKSFLALNPALLDVIRDSALDAESAYPTGTSNLSASKNSIGIAQRYTVRSDLNLDNLLSKTKLGITKYNTGSQSESIKLYQEAFKSAPQFNSLPIKYYEETNIQTNRDELASLISVESFDTLLQNVNIQIYPMTDEMRDIEWL